MLAFRVKQANIGFLFRIEGVEGGELHFQRLTVMAENTEWILLGDIYNIAGPHNYPTDKLQIKKNSTSAGIYVPDDPQLVELMKEGADIHVYYRDGGPRARLKLPQDFPKLVH